ARRPGAGTPRRPGYWRSLPTRLLGVGAVLGLLDHLHPAVDGLVQVVAVALHGLGELVTEQLADIDAIDDHVAQQPGITLPDHGVGDRINRAVLADHLHANAGAIRLGLPLGQDADALVVVIQQGVAVELHQAALEVLLEARHLGLAGHA